MGIIHNVLRHLFEQLMADLTRGHDIRAAVYMECGAMYRADGPEALRCVGEIEFVNGVTGPRGSI
jgi:hypothetical protein